MNITKILFSPTGGTRRVAETITGAWGLPANEVDLTDATLDPSSVSLSDSDVALIAVPSFGGRVPALAAQRLAKIHGNQAQCVIVCVYGNRAYEDTLIELDDIAVSCGFQVVAAVAAIAEHSIMHQYATGRPDAQDKQELTEFAQKILAKIQQPGVDANHTLSLPGNRPYKKAGGAAMVPKAGAACTGCGLCARNCPAQAISLDDPRQTDSKKCISCMRCVVQCPSGARKVNSAMVAAAALALKKVCSVRKDNELFL